ncbi:MAG: cell division protein FtsW [Thermoleophilaceae bacterium]|jgi:cell division protein FtsW|nr:cell division protein FtsW [Thermoleophilaceae bacterium]
MRRPSQRARPLEYTLLYAATLFLLAIGAVMVYSASSATSLLRGPGDPSYYLKRYVVFGMLGLIVMRVMATQGLKLAKTFTPLLLVAGFTLTAAVKLPGIGVSVNGASRWLAAGPVQFQPSELLKLALVLYAAQLLAARPKSVQTIKTIARPLLIVVGAACMLLMAQPDMGTAIVVCLSIGSLLIAAGVPKENLLKIVGVLAVLALIFAVVEPYRRARLLTFLHPWHDQTGAGFQSVQAMIAIGSGGFFGVGLGESVQKIFYLPEAHTDMILAVIGEEWGVLGIGAVAGLFGLLGYAGLRAAKTAKDRYAKLVAAGITGLILSQACLNLFAVMGMAPLTGVPLPFISYGSSNLIVVLAGAGILLNVAGGASVAVRQKRERPQRDSQKRSRRARAPRAA